jgi:hypothetical protein
MAEQPLTAKALATAVLARASAPRRLALTKVEAAASIGVSVDFFEDHVQPGLKVIRQGRKVLIPTAELERWVSENAVRTLDPSRKGS